MRPVPRSVSLRSYRLSIPMFTSCFINCPGVALKGIFTTENRCYDITVTTATFLTVTKFNELTELFVSAVQYPRAMVTSLSPGKLANTQDAQTDFLIF